MKQLRKRIVAVLCVVAMLGGIVFQNGIVLDTKAADAKSAPTTDNTAREWYVYGNDAADTGLVVADTAKGVTSGSISDAGVNLPDGLIEANMELKVKLNVEGTDISTLNGNGVCIELCNELNDCGELNWVFNSFVSGANTISLAFKDAGHTNGSVVNGKGVQDGKSPFDWQETINYFRCYQIGNPSDIKITISEIKIVYTDAGLTFGADDTYLQLDKPMSQTPNAVEATVNMNEIDNRVKWTLRQGGDVSTTSGQTLSTGVTEAGAAPGKGKTYSVFDASSSAQTFTTDNAKLNIDASAYSKEQLAVEFWVYASGAGSLTAAGDNQMRISSSTDGLGANFLYYPLQDVTVQQGWNYISLPLNTWKVVAGQDFNLSNIQRIGFTPFLLSAGSYRYICDINLVVLEAEEEELAKWEICSPSTIANANQTFTTGQTTSSDGPGTGTQYMILDATSSAISGFETRNNGLAINAADYETDKIALAFWVYANTAGKLGIDGNFRLGNLNYIGETPFLYYMFPDISVQAGWNYVVLPLNEWRQDQGNGFNYGNINCFGFAGYALGKGDYRYFGSFSIVELGDEPTIEPEVETEWEIFKPSTVENAGTLNTGTTTTAEGPGAGTEYFILDASTSAITGFGTRNSNLGINAGAYTQEELALAFWVYSNNAGTLGTGDNFRLGNLTYLGETPFLYYMYGEIPVEAGWNYIELPLSDWHQDAGTGFSTSALNCFGFTNFNLAVGEVRWFTDFKIVVLGDDSETVVQEGDIEVTKNISSVAENYMIFSNANATDESNPFALYVTKEGYPAVLYGTTQFVLKQSVATGEDVTIKAAVNSSKQVEFYINGSLAATSKTKVTPQGAPVKAYSIGADGAGAQTFVGTIKNVKAYSDAAASACIGNWSLIGDIRYVVETMPDASGNGNNATFKGTRANDWYDVEKAADDEWSLVFIPDIVQRFYKGEHATWHKMAKWIANNVSKENIKYVVGAKTADPAQAQAANVGYEFFDNYVPTINYNTAEENSYYRFQVNGVKWTILSLKKNWDADASAVFAWGKEVLAKYPNDNVIITCDNYYNSIWSEFNSVNQNVKLIVYGSQGGEPTADAPTMFFPAQNDLENNYFGEQGLGLLYMLRFTEGGTKVTARSYAPIYDSYFTGVVNYEKTIVTETAPEVLNKKYTGATPGTAPADVPEGYIFAGWFKPEPAKEWLLYSKADGNFSGQSMTTESYVTTTSDTPGEGMTCFVFDASTAAISGFDGFQHQESAIDLSAYSMDELAVAFWVYSNKDGSLEITNEGGVAGQLRLGCNNTVYSDFIYYPMSNISVKSGWNYVQVPLSSFHNEAAGETFSLGAITTWGILNGLDVPQGTILRFGDIKLVATGSNGSAEYALKEATTDTVYARFVDEDLLTIKAQVKAKTSDKSNYSDIRFVSSVDRLEYKRIGFKISYMNNGTQKNLDKVSKYVYETLYAVGANDKVAQPYKPSQITAASAKYFKAYTVTNVPNDSFDTDFTVQAYWVTLDGTTVYGELADKSIWMGYPTNNEFLPKIVETTFETDDVVIADVVLNDPRYGYTDMVAGDDWSVALQTALNDVHNNGGGTVYVPAGTYKISESILIPSGVTLRGDWQDPDKEGFDGKYGTVFNIYPTQELTGSNRNADSVHNADSNGDRYSDVAAFVMTGSSGVVGVTAYYPEQTVSAVKHYPYTFYVTVGHDGGQMMTLKNITVINGYRGIGTRYEQQHEELIIDNFKGTFLDCGLALYNCSDTDRITGVSISSKYWKNCSLGSADASSYVLANAVGLELGDLEWDLFSNCSVDGYKIGINIVGGYRTNFTGSMIDMNITNCTTGLTIANEVDSTYYGNPNIDTVGDIGTPDKQEYPLVKTLDPRWGMLIARSTINGTTNAIVNNTTATESGIFGTKVSQTSALVRMTDVDVIGNISTQDYAKEGIFSTKQQNVQSSSEDLSRYDAQYDASYVKPQANLWVVDLEAYDGADMDVSAVITNAMNEFAAYNTKKGYAGGILYIPGGTYRLDNPITVPAGIELRGASAVANREQYIDGEGTLFMCYYGDDASSTSSDTALITLAGDNSGVSGLRFLYPENIITYNTNLNSTYTISANGASNVHVVNCFISTSSYGINLTNCDNFFIENIFSCTYVNTINVSGTGIIRACWSNPSAIVRTSAKGLTGNWPTEAGFDDTSAKINEIRNALKNQLTVIKVSGSQSNVLVQDVTGYALDTLISNEGATVTAINMNADCTDDKGDGNDAEQFYINGGTLLAINALYTSVADNGRSEEATLYTNGNAGGTLSVYNYMTPKIEGEENKSAYKDNIINKSLQ